MQKRKFNSSTIQKLRLNKIEDLEKKLAIQKSPEPSILIELIEVYIKLSDKNKKDILKKHLFSLEESLQSSKQEHQLSEEATGHLSSLFNKASNSDNSEEIVCYGVLLLKCCRMKKESKENMSFMVIKHAWRLLGKNAHRPELENYILHFKKIALNSKFKFKLYHCLAQLYNRKTQYKEALEIIEEAFSLPNWEEVFLQEYQATLFFVKSCVCLNTNNFEETISSANKALALTSDNEAHLYANILRATDSLIKIESKNNNTKKLNKLHEDFKRDTEIFISLTDKNKEKSVSPYISKIALGAAVFEEDEPSKRYKYIEIAFKYGAESLTHPELIQLYGLRLEMYLSQYKKSDINEEQYINNLIKDAISGLTILLNAKNEYSIEEEKDLFYRNFIIAMLTIDTKKHEDILQEIIAALKLSSKEDERDLVYLLSGFLAHLLNDYFDPKKITDCAFKKPQEVSDELKKVMPPVLIVYPLVAIYFQYDSNLENAAYLSMEWFKNYPSEDNFYLAVTYAGITNNIDALSYLREYAETYCTNVDTLKLLQTTKNNLEFLSEENDISSESEEEDEDTKNELTNQKDDVMIQKDLTLNNNENIQIISNEIRDELTDNSPKDGDGKKTKDDNELKKLEKPKQTKEQKIISYLPNKKCKEILENSFKPNKNKKNIEIEQSLEPKFKPRYSLGKNKHISYKKCSLYFYLNPKLQDSLSEDLYTKAKEIVENVKIVPAKKHQGITFNPKQGFKIKFLGNNGKGNIRIHGDEEKELDGTTTIVFGKLGRH
jgi:hypothetical protein